MSLVVAGFAYFWIPGGSVVATNETGCVAAISLDGQHCEVLGRKHAEAVVLEQSMFWASRQSIFEDQ